MVDGIWSFFPESSFWLQLVGPFTFFLQGKTQFSLFSTLLHLNSHALRPWNNSLVDNKHQPCCSLLVTLHRLEHHHYSLYRDTPPLHAVPDAPSDSWIGIGVYLCYFHDGGIRSALYRDRFDISRQLRC
jgi:hypothetical protein